MQHLKFKQGKEGKKRAKRNQSGLGTVLTLLGAVEPAEVPPLAMASRGERGKHTGREFETPEKNMEGATTQKKCPPPEAAPA